MSAGTRAVGQFVSRLREITRESADPRAIVEQVRPLLRARGGRGLPGFR